MKLDSLRKLIVTPIGFTILFAVVWQLLTFGASLSLFSVAESLLLGFIISALIMLRGPRKHFFEVAGRNKVSTMRRFVRLIQQGKAPKEEEQRHEFLEYMNSLAEVYEKRSWGTEIGAFIFLIFMLILYVTIIGHGVMAGVFAVTIAYGMYGTVHSKITLKRIYAIKKKYYGA